jgi:hypothetical protein
MKKTIIFIITLMFLLFTQLATAKMTIMPLKGTVTDSTGQIVSGDIAVEIFENGDSIYDDGDSITAGVLFKNVVINGRFNVVLGAKNLLDVSCKKGYEVSISFRKIGEEGGFTTLTKEHFAACEGDIYLNTTLTAKSIEIRNRENKAEISIYTRGIASSNIVRCLYDCPAFEENLYLEGIYVAQSPEDGVNLVPSNSVQTGDLIVRGDLEIEGGKSLVKSLVPNNFCVFTFDDRECPEGWIDLTELNANLKDRTIRGVRSGASAGGTGRDDHTHFHWWKGAFDDIENGVGGGSSDVWHLESEGIQILPTSEESSWPSFNVVRVCCNEDNAYIPVLEVEYDDGNGE